MSNRNAMLAIAVAAGLASSSAALAVVPTVDGTLDAGYTRFATQTTQTQFGDDTGSHGGSELDAGYYHIENGKLYVFLAGNVEHNYNKLAIFFDTRAGGQNQVRTDNPNFDNNVLNDKYGGMKFDAAFSPDYYFSFDHDTNALYPKFSEMNTGGGGFGGDNFGSVPLFGANEAGSATVGGENGFPSIQLGFDNSNTGGVGGGSGAASAGEITAANAVSTGAEFSIDLTALGITGNFKMMVGINGSGNDFWSNQFLPGLTTPSGNLGNVGGNLHTFDFGTIDGDQFIEIQHASPISHWTAAGSGSWNNGANWTGGVIPNAADAQAYLDSTNGAGAKSVTLDTNVTLAYLNFDSAGGYTILPSGANTLTIAGNAATPAVQVVSGNHVIAAPLILGATTNFTIAAGSSLNVTGDLTSTGMTVVKAGPGLLQVKKLTNTNNVFVSEGTIRLATNGVPSNVSKLGNVNFDGGYAAPIGAFDVNDNDVVLTANSYADVTTAIAYARHGNAWDRGGIASSAAATALVKNKTIGVVTGAEWHSITTGTTQFDGLDVADTDLLLKYTYYGDSNFNGKVDGGDYARIDTTFNTEHTAGNIGGWSNGDYNYDNKVDGADYGLIDSAFNSQSGVLARALAYIDGSDTDTSDMTGPALGAVVDHLGEFGEPYAAAFISAVPEPTTGLAVLIGGAGAMLSRRRRKSL